MIVFQDLRINESIDSENNDFAFNLFSRFKKKIVQFEEIVSLK